MISAQENIDCTLLHHDPLVHQQKLDEICHKKGYLIDMDNVIYKGSHLLPGARELIEFLQTNNKKYLLLTNDSSPTPRELQYKFQLLGLDIDKEHFFTSGQATAYYLDSEMPKGGTVYVIGEPGLCLSLYEKGFYMNDHNPDYVILGETPNYNFEKITKAIQLVQQGAKLIATNLDVANVDAKGNKIPCTGAFVACIESVTQTTAFSCGKPSVLIMQYAQQLLGLDKSDTCIIETEISSKNNQVLILAGNHDTYTPFVIVNDLFEIMSNKSLATDL